MGYDIVRAESANWEERPGHEGQAPDDHDERRRDAVEQNAEQQHQQNSM